MCKKYTDAHPYKALYSEQLNRTTLIPNTCPQNNPDGKKYLVAILQASTGLELLTVGAGSASKRLYGPLIVPSTSNNLWKLTRRFPGACKYFMACTKTHEKGRP